MSRRVALLRGVNVGGKAQVSMTALVRLFEEAGCTKVESYIQSGNVVFDASAALAKKLAARIADDLEREFGVRVAIALRTADELAALEARNPYLGRGTDHAKIAVTFLGVAPAADAIAKLDPKRSPPDEFVVDGSEIFLHCPNGVGRTKLTNDWFESRLGTFGTARNWRTVRKLVELSSR